MIRGRHTALTRPLQYLALAVFMIFLAFPVVFLLVTALKPPSELLAPDPSFLPKEIEWSNFTEAIDKTRFWTTARNSAVVATVTMAVTILVALPAAYALARFPTRLRGLATGWILLSQVFPFILIIIPLFMVLRDLELIDTHIGLIAVYTVWSLPFALWMLRGYIIGIPTDLEEAGAMDGASRSASCEHHPSAAGSRTRRHGAVHVHLLLERVLLRLGADPNARARDTAADARQLRRCRGPGGTRPARRRLAARGDPEPRLLRPHPTPAGVRTAERSGEGMNADRLVDDSLRCERATTGLAAAGEQQRERPSPDEKNQDHHCRHRPRGTRGDDRRCGTGGASGESVALTFQSLAFQEPTVAATDEIVAAWNEANPDIQVELRQGSWDNVHDELVTQFAGGTAPDIIHDESADIMGFAQQGYLADLTPYFGEELIADVPEGVWQAVTTPDGAIVAAPTLMQSYVVFANVDAFEAAGVEVPTGETLAWDDFEQLAADLTTDDSFGLGWGLRSPTATIMNLALGFDGDFFTVEGEEVAFEAGDAEMEVPRRIHDLAYEAAHSTRCR